MKELKVEFQFLKSSCQRIKTLTYVGREHCSSKELFISGRQQWRSINKGKYLTAVSAPRHVPVLTPLSSQSRKLGDFFSHMQQRRESKKGFFSQTGIELF